MRNNREFSIFDLDYWSDQFNPARRPVSQVEKGKRGGELSISWDMPGGIQSSIMTASPIAATQLDLLYLK